MWNDIETSTDYLHFSVVSQAVADMIVESGKSPISIGVSGSWGSGKSSMVKMIGRDLHNLDEKGENYIFLEFTPGFIKDMTMLKLHSYKRFQKNYLQR